MSNGDKSTKRSTTRRSTTKQKKRTTKNAFAGEMPPAAKIGLWVILVLFVAVIACVLIGGLCKFCFGDSNPPAPTEESPQETSQKQEKSEQKPKEKSEQKSKEKSEQKSEQKSENKSEQKSEKPKSKTKKVTAACLVQLEVRDYAKEVAELCRRDQASSPADQRAE